MQSETALRVVKVVHTIIWAFFVACIFGAPIAASTGHLKLALVLVGLVAIEALVLLVHKWACPLTAVAARFTGEREPNFVIYLPRWLAKHNKTIFTPLYLAGAAYTVHAWWHGG